MISNVIKEGFPNLRGYKSEGGLAGKTLLLVEFAASLRELILDSRAHRSLLVSHSLVGLPVGFHPLLGSSFVEEVNSYRGSKPEGTSGR